MSLDETVGDFSSLEERLDELKPHVESQAKGYWASQRPLADALAAVREMPVEELKAKSDLLKHLRLAAQEIRKAELSDFVKDLFKVQSKNRAAQALAVAVLDDAQLDAIFEKSGRVAECRREMVGIAEIVLGEWRNRNASPARKKLYQLLDDSKVTPDELWKGKWKGEAQAFLRHVLRPDVTNLGHGQDIEAINGRQSRPTGAGESSIDEILRKEQAKREQREHEEAAALPYRRQQDEQFSAFESMTDSFSELLNARSTKQNFSQDFAKAIVAFGKAIMRPAAIAPKNFAQERFQRIIGASAGNDDPAREYAVEILEAASKGGTKEVVRLLLRLTQSYDSVPSYGDPCLFNEVIDQLRDGVSIEIMGFTSDSQHLADLTPEQRRRWWLELYRNAAEHWQADLIREDWREKVANKIAYKVNAAERELWPETPELGFGRTVLAKDALAAVETMLKRINAELSPKASEVNQTGDPCAMNGQKPPTNPTVKAALAIIRSEKGSGLVAKEIISKLAKKGITITDGTFRRHIVTELKTHGIKNHRARGGYYDSTCLESM